MLWGGGLWDWKARKGQFTLIYGANERTNLGRWRYDTQMETKSNIQAITKVKYARTRGEVVDAAGHLLVGLKDIGRRIPLSPSGGRKGPV